MGVTKSFDGLESDFGRREEGHQKATRRFSVSEIGKKAGVRIDINARLISLDCIVSHEQMRKDFDKAALAELTHSVELHGVQQPILVYWNESEQKYVIIAGERRYRAAQAVGSVDEIPCKIHPHEPDECEKAELQFVENTTRQDFSPIEEAMGYKKLMRLFGYTTTEMGKRLGKNQSTISRSLRLLELPDDLVAKIGTREIPKAIAEEMLKLPGEDEQRDMAERYLSGNLTTAEAKQVVKDIKSGAKSRGGAKSKATKKWSRAGHSISMTSPPRTTNNERIQVLEEILQSLKQDGRTKVNQAA